MIDRDRLAANLEAIRLRIARAAVRGGRDPRSVTVVAVTKGIDRATVQLAYEFGLRTFAENRVQEAWHKFVSAPLPSDAELHLIGHLQTNKVRQAVRLFSMIHSVDRLRLVEALARRAEQEERRLPVLVQVNVAGEAQKHGCRPDEALALVRAVLAAPHLELRGLMTIGPLTSTADEIRQVFRRLRVLRDELQQQCGCSLPELSMGMSNDFEIAVEEGATMVRIGRALFGA
ncbi:MAG: YggS family pyridoxal phosphate-dependent enzyme [Thermomicrobium sp.]|nr:YggS family pyridoxal phosphate-dependent enzyme [Thermomicrobium sp.]MDW7981771.1 YggS family pyridoxal phosphate-dependent enzyme [Thermomicrobium sp.]